MICFRCKCKPGIHTIKGTWEADAPEQADLGEQVNTVRDNLKSRCQSHRHFKDSEGIVS